MLLGSGWLVVRRWRNTGERFDLGVQSQVRRHLTKSPQIARCSNCGEDTHVKVTSDEIEVVLLHVAIFSTPILWMCTEQNATVIGVPESEGRCSRPLVMSRITRTFACGVFLEGNHHRVGLEGVLFLSNMARSVLPVFAMN